ncbi:MAG TPA: outer membrane protein assembly factor BamB [Gammaproteobacteria bacterium]|nr:outer membrane protein assembly factor BamB [Gammaproteobacteria bacterium]
MMRLLPAFLLASLLAACASDNVEPPAPLTTFTPQLKVLEAWSRTLSAAEETLLLHLDVVSDGTDLYTLTHSGDVYSLYAKNGGTRWKTDTKLELTAGPGVNDGMVAVAAEGGMVIALDAKDGHILWQSPVDGAVLASPAVGAGIVVVRTTDGRVLALAADSGRQRWKTAYDVPRLSLRGASMPVILDRQVLVGLDDGRLVALKVDDGSQAWQTPVGAPSGSNELSRVADLDGIIAVAGDDVYAVAYQGQVMAITRQNGQVLWAREMASYTGVSVDQTHVYVTDLHSTVWALDKATGVAVWSQPVLRAHDLTVPVPFGDAVVVGGIEGDLHFLSKLDGSLMARVSLGSSRINVPPLVMGDRLIAVSTGGDIASYGVLPIKTQ